MAEFVANQMLKTVTVVKSWLLPLWSLQELFCNLAGNGMHLKAQHQAAHLSTHAQTLRPQARLLTF